MSLRFAHLQGEDLFKFDFDPKALKQKYMSERDKRLNKKGNDQFTWIQHDNEFGHLLEDPWVEPIKREALKKDVTVIVLGGGFSGIFTGKHLRDKGIEDFLIIEKGGDYGGTWYWNRYPGAACDSEAYCYLPLLEETGYMPKFKYTSAPEILEHCNRMGTQFGLYPKTLFQTECTEVKWDDATCRWMCKTDRGDLFRAQFVIAASGPLHKPKLPGVPGIKSFKGHNFHTSRWDYNYTGGNSYGNLTNLQDKRVAIIGTGATAVQCIPHLGKWSKHLYVFQRTPSSVDVRNNNPTDPKWWAEMTKQKGWQYNRDLNFAMITSGRQPEVDLVNDGWTDMFRYQYALAAEHAKGKYGQQYSKDDLAQLADFQKMEHVRRRVDQIVKDPKTAESLKPFYNRMCKRPTFSDEYLQTFNLPNVTLVDTNGKGIDAISEKGVIANGVEYEVDCIIWGSGFEIGTSWKSRNGFDLIGKDGLTLQQKWRKGMRSLYGISTRGFPNFAMFQNAQAGRSTNFPWVYNMQALWTVDVIRQCLDKGVACFDVDAETEAAWTKEIEQKSLLQKLFLTECTPGYYNFEGQTNRLVTRNTSFGEGPIRYGEILKEWVADGTMKGMELTYEKDVKPRPRL